ncbi:hypothetical protein FLA_1945 [Filimonas lacunae]|nr:hypothetical protein FLA_1945 [Filimonas lacunae]
MTASTIKAEQTLSLTTLAEFFDISDLQKKAEFYTWDYDF